MSSIMLTDIQKNSTTTPTFLHLDNFSAVLLALYRAKSKIRKHVEICAHRLGHHVCTPKSIRNHIPTNRNLSDLLAKSLDKETFQRIKPLMINPALSHHRMPEHLGV